MKAKKADKKASTKAPSNENKKSTQGAKVTKPPKNKQNGKDDKSIFYLYRSNT